MNNQVAEKLNQLVVLASEQNYSAEAIELIKKAAVFADEKHEGQKRASGEPYIIHPLATAEILLTWKMDVATVVTGVLHDVLEDTLTQETEIGEIFGEEIEKLVKYVTKASLYSKKNRKDTREKSKIENDYIAQVFLSTIVDLRAMIVKLADRYHNMTTLEFLKPEKQKRIAKETFDVYARVAGKMGMYKFKTVLQDLSFKILQPKEYEATANKIEQLVNAHNDDWEEVRQSIETVLNDNNVKYTLKNRIKGIYSTWNKMNNGHSITDIRDIYAMRIIVDNVLDCYKVLGLIHLNFNYINNAFKDYIANPKFNLYQSIHTTIVNQNTIMEIQIRTAQMDEEAEYGLASHWSYKDKIRHNSLETDMDNNPINKIEKNYLIQEFIKNPNKTSEEIRNLTQQEVHSVFVMNNEQKYIVNLNTRAIELAYKYDPNRLPYLNKIIINGKGVPFDIKIQTGDLVKFIFANEMRINQSWFNFTNDALVTNAIQNTLESIERNKIMNIDNFMDRVTNELGSQFIGVDKINERIKTHMHINNLNELLEKIPLEAYEDENFINMFDRRKAVSKNAINNFYETYYTQFLKPRYLMPIKGTHFEQINFPTCCNKIPYMNVIGIIDKNNVLHVHNSGCKMVNNLKKHDKKVILQWDDEQLEKFPKNFKYTLTFHAVWTPSIGNDITSLINKFKISLNQISIKRDKENKTCFVKLVLYVNNYDYIKFLKNKLEEEIHILPIQNG